MQKQSKNSPAAAGGGRILFTGSGTRVIDDLMGHSPETNQMGKCQLVETEFMTALDEFYPHVLVVCMGDEPRAALHLLDGLKNLEKYQNLAVIVVGNEEDCENFKENVFLKETRIFTRPLDRPGFYEALSKFLAAGIERDNEEQRKSPTPAALSDADAETLAQTELLAVEDSLVRKIQAMTRLHGRKTILVVDDDVRMLNIIKLYLQDLYNVVVVPSGKLALKYLAKRPADLMLLDYMMPEEDGPTILAQVRGGSSNQNIPVVFLTGVSDKDMVLRGLEMRPSGYLLKPVTRAILLEKVTEILLGI